MPANRQHIQVVPVKAPSDSAALRECLEDIALLVGGQPLRTAAAVRSALREGVLPGGGVALLNLKPVLPEKVRQAEDMDEIVAHKILLKAVEAPLRALLNNAGRRPEPVLAQLAHCPAGHGFDVMGGEVKDLAQAGIVDAATVVKRALGKAIHSAALALTIDVLIQRANPPLGIRPQ